MFTGKREGLVLCVIINPEARRRPAGMSAKSRKQAWKRGIYSSSPGGGHLNHGEYDADAHFGLPENGQ